MAKLRATIVEEDARFRRTLRDLLGQAEGLTVVGEAPDIDAARKLVAGTTPDVVFLGAEIAELAASACFATFDIHAPFVVVVASGPDQAARAFDLGAIDYLITPLDGERLARSVGRIRDARERLLRNSAYVERIAVRVGRKIRLVDLREVDYLRVAGSYIHMLGRGHRHVVREALRRLEPGLDPRRFVRVNRSVIVNLDSVRELESRRHGDYLIRLRGGEQLLLSRKFRDRFRHRFGREF